MRTTPNHDQLIKMPRNPPSVQSSQHLLTVNKATITRRHTERKPPRMNVESKVRDCRSASPLRREHSNTISDSTVALKPSEKEFEFEDRRRAQSIEIRRTIGTKQLIIADRELKKTVSGPKKNKFMTWVKFSSINRRVSVL
mmetsp:Transcript_12373/g.18554  ORF Transcript_12373/g.18554 Transcript_12373/m.18554 type:complete len:141 (-) Transcript_12373:223-645(-)